jgi:hypothetical protein
MRDADFFKFPDFSWQKQYEALRALFVDRLPGKVVANRFGYSYNYIRLLKCNFLNNKINFNDPTIDDKISRRKVSLEIRQKIIELRKKSLSGGDIAQLLHQDHIEISISTIERVLSEEGFPKLPRRTQLKIGCTIKQADIPEKSEKVTLQQMDGSKIESDTVGLFLFAPFLTQLNIAQVIKNAGLPGSKIIPAMNYFLSFLALKLLGTERYAHVGEYGFDALSGLFTGLNILPKCTAMSTYSYSLDELHIQNFQKAFISQAKKIGLYDSKIINLDFHTIPHFGEASVLEKHWAGARGKAMKGALTLFAQDMESKLMVYSNANILRREQDLEVLQFLDFWKKIERGIKPTLVFDSKLTTYENLSQLTEKQVNFITLRRRGTKLINDSNQLIEWERIHIANVKRKYPNPQIHDSLITLRGYDAGELRQIIVRGTGREKPSFLITNDMQSTAAEVVGNYSKRWRIEKGIGEAVKFFHLNALSSPILVKVHFDVAMTMIADTLYTMFAQKLRGFEGCDAPTIFRHFVKGKGSVSIQNSTLNVCFNRRAHNPILREVPWHTLPMELPGLEGGKLNLKFL